MVSVSPLLMSMKDSSVVQPMLNQIALTVRSPMVRANSMPGKMRKYGLAWNMMRNQYLSGYHIFWNSQNMTVLVITILQTKHKKLWSSSTISKVWLRSATICCLPSVKGKDLGVHGDRDLVRVCRCRCYFYYFNKNMSTFVDYKINLIDDSKFTKTAGIDTDDIVAVGLVYQF